MELTYGSYLRISQLLDQQRVQSEPEEHDELLFIIIHQAYELWFKQVLHELDRVGRYLSNEDMELDDAITQSNHQLHRVRRIFETLVGQIHILETMTPLEFLSFRKFLDEASGFQSAQFRELESLLGLTDTFDPNSFIYDENEHERLVKRLNDPTVWDLVLAFLARHGHDIPKEVLERDYAAPQQANPEVEKVIAHLYVSDPQARSLFERLLDIDELLQEWRYRHVMMVQRTIGNRTGTGGSSGVGYLRSTLFRPCFPDLWNVRAQF